MAKISVLSPQVANMIAAGEVVERPASVIKELMENSIDAGAHSLTVEIRGGGVLYMRITDDGCGMEAEDAKVAFLRHATSKIKYENDLSAIHTLGFRGEALAAISAVAKVDLFTKPAAAPLGTHLMLEAGEILSEEETGCPDGTTLVIKDLFFNTPARMKFLKKDMTEAAYIATAVEQVAMAHPDIAVRFIKDGKEQLYTEGNGNLLSVLYAIYGREFSGQMVAFSGSQRDVQLLGYISSPGYSRGNRGMQVFMVNGRAIRSKLLTAAVEQAYSGYMMHGRFPACFLDLKVNASTVDVNVHPAKMEVKFANEKEVFSTVYQFITSALEGQAQNSEPAPAAKQGDIKKTPGQKSAFQSAAKPSYRSPLFTAPESEKQSAGMLASDSRIAYQTKFSVPMPTNNPEKPAFFSEKALKNPQNSTVLPSFSAENGVKIGGYRTKMQGIEVEITSEEAEALEGKTVSPAQNTPCEIIGQGEKTVEPLTGKASFSAAENQPIGDSVRGAAAIFLGEKQQNPQHAISNSQSEKQQDQQQGLPCDSMEQEPGSESNLDRAEAVMQSERDGYAGETQQGSAALSAEEAPAFTLLGELFATYLVLQIGDEMVMIDKHAAHERMIYNKIEGQTGGEDAQTLLAPLPLSVNRLEKAALLEHTEELEKVGFEVEDFGDSSVMVRRVPMYLPEKDIAYVLTDIAQKLMDLRRARADALEEIIKSVSCKTAVKAGTFTDIDEMRNFAEKVLKDPKVRSCPHGRPVLFTMSRQEIEKQFKRIV